LAELNLRGVTGATVLAIQRDNSTILIPEARVALNVGDLITLTGSHEAIVAAKKILIEIKGIPGKNQNGD
jgi:CPA2 family monovalent cation:H+ antiporter-2